MGESPSCNHYRHPCPTGCGCWCNGCTVVRVVAQRDKADLWILQHAERGTHDHACVECMPGGPMIVAGFQCALHAARERQARHSRR